MGHYLLLQTFRHNFLRNLNEIWYMNLRSKINSFQNGTSFRTNFHSDCVSHVRLYNSKACQHYNTRLRLSTLKKRCPKFKSLVKCLPRTSPNQRLLAIGLGVCFTSWNLKSNVADCSVMSGSKTRLLEKKEEKRDESQEFDWWMFLSFLKEDTLLMLVSVLSALIVSYINVQIPVYLGDMVQVVSHFIRDQTSKFYLQEIRTPAIKLITAYSLQALFTAGYISVLGVVGERLASRVRNALFTSLLRQDIAFYDVHHTGELVNRLSGDVQELKRSFKLCISQGLKGTTHIVGSAVSMYILSPKLTVVLLGTVPVIVLFGSMIGAVLRKMSRSAQEQVSRAMSVADEAIANIRTVRGFAMEKQEGELFASEIAKAQRQNAILGFGIGIFQGLSTMFFQGLVLGVIYSGGYLMSTGEIQAGQLMSFLVAAQSIQRSLAFMSILFGQAIRGFSAGGRVFEFIKLEPSIPITGGKTIPYYSLNANVQFRGVHFSYPSRKDQKILENFNLELPRGKVIAICGPSGAGKSTVATLLERFYDVDEGSIIIDGIDLKDCDPTWLRGSTIGYINQEPTLFATTIRENIRYGKANAEDVEVMEAAVMANAHEFISEFPHGYDTVLGERGVTISGGQKQRIAIARALIKNPSILILDEATSALDTESERLVQEAIDRVSRGRTVLVIAHRLSTIRNADAIVVLHNGKVQELGSHEELIKKNGVYAELVKRQAFVDS